MLRIFTCAQLFAGVFNSSPWNEAWEIETVAARLQDFHDAAGFCGLMAMEDSELLGFALGNAEQWDKTKHFNLREMCVATDKQGSGVGKSLILALETALVGQGINRIYLVTARDGQAQSFYEKCSFYVSPKMILMAKRDLVRVSGETR
jgi:aminoglycoside 6'-N-acetyltransferase I